MESEKRIVDLDGAFDKRVAEYFAKKKNKYTEEEWEDAVAELYKQYGDTKIELLGATPNEYYARMTQNELIVALRNRFRKDVPIDGFLRAAAEEKKNRDVLISLLDGDNEEASFALDILGADKSLYPTYLNLLRRENAEKLRGETVEILQEDADFICDELLKLYAEDVAKDCVADILSHCLIPRDDVFSILLDDFLKSEDKENAATRLGRYGDERALPYIKERASFADTGYLAWRAMRVAAEALGGKLPERDFSHDEEYLVMQREEEKIREEREKKSSEDKK